MKFLLLIYLVFTSNWVFSQNPHGDKLERDCKSCHSSGDWTFNSNPLKFSHDSTSFRLEGSHKVADCKDCHSNLVFEDAETTCISCHLDVHGQSTGNDCTRCHNSDTWSVSNIPELHEENGFPLVGAHQSLSCENCHLSDNQIKWERIGNECVTCHSDDYSNSTNPDHTSAGFSTDCLDCHDPFSQTWGNGTFHLSFPLTQGHSINDCAACHDVNNFAAASPDCISCHQEDFNSTTIPNHNTSGFSLECTLCHDTNAWFPADFSEHDDLFFPIFTGKHAEEWESCTDCHTTQGNFTSFSCIECHEHSNNTEVSDDHENVSGFQFESNACYSCHPTGQD